MIRGERPGFRKTFPIRPFFSNRMGQLVQLEPKVEFRPDVKVQAPLNIELGGLPLSLGLFIGSGLAFLMKPQLPEGWPQSLALFTGAGLAVGGIMNMLLPKAEAAATTAPPPAPAPIPAVTPSSAPFGGVGGPPSYTPPSANAFDGISGRVEYPGETETVDIWPTASSYPIRLQLYNPSSERITFYVEIVANEMPHPYGEEMRTTYPVQVTLEAGQTYSVDVSMPISAWGPLVDYVDVDINVYKRRLPGEDAQRIATRFLVIE